MVEGRDLNDSDILKSTTQEQDGNKVRYSTTLPSGRKVFSEWMRKEDMKGKTVVTWCEFIRAQVDVDAQEKAATKKRDSVEPEDIEEEVRQVEVAEAQNPIEYARHQRDLYQERQHLLEERYTELKIQIKTNRRHLENWETIVASLRGETDE